VQGLRGKVGQPRRQSARRRKRHVKVLQRKEIERGLATGRRPGKSPVGGLCSCFCGWGGWLFCVGVRGGVVGVLFLFFWWLLLGGVSSKERSPYEGASEKGTADQSNKKSMCSAPPENASEQPPPSPRPRVEGFPFGGTDHDLTRRGREKKCADRERNQRNAVVQTCRKGAWWPARDLGKKNGIWFRRVSRSGGSMKWVPKTQLFLKERVSCNCNNLGRRRGAPTRRTLLWTENLQATPY